jgi:hypothetical protein
VNCPLGGVVGVDLLLLPLHLWNAPWRQYRRWNTMGVKFHTVLTDSVEPVHVLCRIDPYRKGGMKSHATWCKSFMLGICYCPFPSDDPMQYYSPGSSLSALNGAVWC